MNHLSSDTNLMREPVAIIGVGCRFPGANDLKSFWRILRDGIETVGEYPGGRFGLIDDFYSGKSGDRTKATTRRGGFLNGLDQFDADFFGISPREAVLLDPQQRLLLEISCEALEDAGLPTTSIAGSRTGVFIGQWTSDYEACVNDSVGEPHLYSTTGSGRYAASGRLAYLFDFRGPNLTLDTACSSSLVALHLACQSLRSGESELALAGGVSVILRPEVSMAYGAAGMLSPDGRCKFGDAAANGYVRSEGAGVVVLKLLRRAIEDHDPIHAVIRGTATNNDGRSSGLLVSPSCEGQAAMIRAALDNAGVTAADVDYIEAHGTGTAAGDPVEVLAIGAVLAETPRVRPCLVGSVKTNIGHAEAAAGMAGLCKVVLALQHGTVPPTLHYRQPSPKIPWADLPVTINHEAQTWPHTDGRRIAGLNSFGITGTNAHAVVENAPPRQPLGADVPNARLYLLSARTPAALEQAALSWRQQMQAEPLWPGSMANLAYTAAVRRNVHDFRLAIVARDRAELDTQLALWLAREPAEMVQSGRAATNRPRVVFVFPGQGGQWTGMGRELFAKEPAFRDALVQCDRVIRTHTGWSVIDKLLSPAEGAAEIDRVQPSLFALMISLAAMWRSWGVEPDAVVGHSMGEAAAAVVCGALSLEDGAAVICHRSRLMRRASGSGLMAMAALTLADAEEIVGSRNGRISVAANNSPNSTILSGDSDAIEEVIAELEAREIFCRRIQVDVASHCAHMDPISPEVERILASLAPRRAQIPLYSTSTGRIEDGLALGASYWSYNLREPVLFAGSIDKLLRDGFQTFVEINAHPVLLQSIEECARQAQAEVLTVSSLRRDKEQVPEMLAGLGKLHVNGYPVDFKKVYPGGECLRLPAYSWQRERYWPEESHGGARRPAGRGSHPNLGACLESSLTPGVYLCDVEFRPPSDGVQAAGWCLDVVMAASAEVLGSSSMTLEDVQFPAIPMPCDLGQLVFTRSSEGTFRFCLSGKARDRWVPFCEGNLRQGSVAAAESQPVPSLEIPLAPGPRQLSACLQLAATSLGYTEGDAGWVASGIERIERFAPESKQARVRAFSDPVNDKCAHSSIDEPDGSCAIRVSGLHFEFSRKPDYSRHIYQWKWLELDAALADEKPTGVFVIVGDALLSAQIASRLYARNVECVFVPSTDSVRDVVESLGSACRAIIWASAERSSAPEPAIGHLRDVMSLVRAVTSVSSTEALSLWLITTGAHDILSKNARPSDRTKLSAAQSSIWGLARVITCEHPELRCIAVDLSPIPDPEEFETLSRLAVSHVSEEQMAIRGAKRYGLRLERKQEEPIQELTLSPDATYLITGGRGGLGLGLAKLLAEHGAREIALVGRTAPAGEVLESIEAIQKNGARVRSFQADVASYAQLQSVLAEIASEMAPLKGVFHLAGITEDALLSDTTRESLERVMTPKALGAWNLHSLTANYDLNFFVMYSSLAAVSSQPGQGSYAAANAYLDGLARFRNASGLRAMSIQWGPWKDTGMIRQSGASNSLHAWAEQGIGSMSTDGALDAVHRLLVRPATVAFVSPVDWTRFARTFDGKVPPVFSGVSAIGSKAAPAETKLRDKLASLPERERNSSLEAHLKTVLAGVLKTKVSRIDSSSRFGSFGVDSIMAVEIARRVADTVGVRLPVTALFNFPTLHLLTEEVCKRLDTGKPSEAANRQQEAGSDASTAKPLPAITQMTEEEAVLSLVKVMEAR